jgi:hypothetical protein
MTDPDLIAAIKTHWDGDATLTALDLYYGIVPENSTFPCARQFFISSNLDNAFGVRHHTEVRVQFNIYANTIASLKTYLDALAARFDRTSSLSVSGATAISCVRVLNWPVKPEGVDKSSEKVYSGGADYRIAVADSF